MKKILSLLLTLTMLLGTTSVMAYSDVSETNTSIELLTNLGVLDGFDDGSFKPNETVTRAQMAKMICEALGYKNVMPTATDFIDVPTSHWASGYIATGAAKGYINGYDDVTFGPEDTVTYAQAVKMLVGAAGYDTWAQQIGGWPTGYLSYGSSLEITAGVDSVTNNTPITRVQCATLIANAMKAPLLVVDGYENVGTINGVTIVPNYVQKDGYGKDWVTMLTKYHNAYEVRGRVTGTFKTDACDKDEVVFSIENTRNIDGDYTNGNSIPKTVKFGNTNAENMMFEYASAVLVKDEDTNEFTIASIAPYGATKTVEISAKLVDTIDEEYIYVFKSDKTTDTKRYKLDDATVYVNGYELPAGYDVLDYVGDNNKFGTVTLIDESEVSSSVADGDYDVILINYTISDMVTYTRTTSSANEIILESGAKLTYDPEDEDASIVFVKNGVEIDFDDIDENDVLTITKAVDQPLTNLTSAVVVITNDTVSGTVTKTSDDAVYIDGEKYAIADDVTAMLSKYYTFFLDANGVIVASDVVSINVNYGIITKLMYDNTEDAVLVSVITDEGDTATYEAKDAAEIAAALGVAAPTSDTTITWSYDDVVANPSAAVVQYKTVGNKIRLTDEVEQVNTTTEDLVYRASTSKLAGYKMANGTTKILDISAYLADKNDDVVTMTTNMFEDELTYDAYIFDKNDNGAYQFVLITNGTNNVRPNSTLAIVKEYIGDTQVDDEDVREYTILKNGEEATLYIAGGSALAEGTIVMYPNVAKNYVENTKIVVVYTPANSYDTLWSAIMSESTVFDAIDNDVITGGTLDVNGRLADVKVYAGIVLNANVKSIDLLTSTADELKDAEDLDIYNANVYTYNYNKLDNRGYRVEAANVAVNEKVYRVIADADFNTIDWSDAVDAEIYAPIAIVREIDNEVTDVFYFINE